MSDFCSSRGNGLKLDPRKRVNYSLGLVLGEDEFRQEQFYLQERDELATRALHGYGTVVGLGIQVADNQVTVLPGLAADPEGRFICVSTPQCADLPRWLEMHQAEVETALDSSFPDEQEPLSVYVTLCHRECPTDLVPVPVEPCRTAEESMVASRTMDSFELSLNLVPPGVVGETTPSGLDAAIGSLVFTSEFLGGSLPEGSLPEGTLPEGSLPVTNAREEIRATIRTWAVEGRPKNEGDEPCLGGRDNKCILLGRLDLRIELQNGKLVLAGPAALDDNDRPILLSTRFLQEWLIRLQASEAGEIGPLVLALDELSDVNVPSPSEGQVLTLQNSAWVAKYLPPVVPGVTDHGALTGLDGDDHTHYLLSDGTRTMTGNLRAGNNRLTGLADATALQDAVTLAQLNEVSAGGAAAGDLEGNYPNPTVAALQGVPVLKKLPQLGDSLVFDGAIWAPEHVPRLFLPFVTIAQVEFRTFELWFNVDAPGNDVEIEKLAPPVVQAESDNPPFLNTLMTFDPIRLSRNVFRIQVEEVSPLMRFTFQLGSVEVDGGQRAFDFFAAKRVTFEGQEGTTVTKFVRVGFQRFG